MLSEIVSSNHPAIRDEPLSSCIFLAAFYVSSSRPPIFLIHSCDLHLLCRLHNRGKEGGLLSWKSDTCVVVSQ